jgi:hypothetical protein
MASLSNPTVFRPKSSLITLGAFYLFILGMNISAWYTSSIRTCTEMAFISVALALLTYLAYGRPKIIFFDEGLTIVNPTESVTLCWAEVEGIDTKYTLRIQTRDRNIGAWAAPGPSRRQAKKAFSDGAANRINTKGLGIDPAMPISPADLAETHSGGAAAIARYRLTEYSRLSQPARFETVQLKSYYTLISAIVLALIGSILIVTA